MTKPTSAARIVAWGLATFAACETASVVLIRSRIANAAVAAAIAEWGAGRAEVTWSDPDATPPTVATIAKRAGRGFGLGTAAAILVIAVALAFRSTTFAPNHPDVAALGTGLVVTLLACVRDELLLRGVVLRLFGPLTPRLDARIACAVAAAAASLAEPGVAPSHVAVAALGGSLLAAVWQRDRGAWMALGVNAAWSWGTGTVVRGGLVDLRGGARSWWSSDGALGGAPVAVVVLAAIAVALVADESRRTSAV
jgi:membrane protease YdiL (CAAX protease family)